MIPLDAFLPAVCAAVPRFQDSPPDPRQAACILAPRATPLMVVAGPGSGKTTVLVLRSLRLVFVDGLLPESVVITTFTRKAADELRSRLIDWGLSLLDHLSQNSPSARPHGLRQWLETVDLNRFITGTLDSICEDTLTTYRDPGDAPPVLVEGFVGNALLAREGLWRSGALDSPALDSYLAQFTFGGRTPRNFGETTALCRTVVDRLVHDQVDVAAFEAGMPYTPGRQVVVGALRGYRSYMEQTNRMDFGALEEVFLARLSQGRLKRFSSAIQAVVVDEYQDTNPLQESIYFELVQQTRPSLTIVGDDDQALYRFRGATVELFCDFPRRLHAAVPAMPGVRTEHLVNNYRSTPEIASFVNDYVAYDSAYAGARVQPPKPPIVAQRRASGIPVLGLFRPDAATLARDLASFLHAVFRGDGRPVTVGGQTIQVSGHPEGGDVGDAVVLAHTVQEFGNRFGSRPPRPRLPFLLRQELADPRRRIGVFNPGGRALRDIPEVQQLLGLVLLCIDPPASPSSLGTQQASARLRSDARHYLTVWRAAGQRLAESRPPPDAPRTLAQFVAGWQGRINQTARGAPWPDEWPILELCYKLVTWMPFFQDDPEGHVYLEAISRCVAQAATFSPYRSAVLHGRGRHDDRSVLRAIMDIMVPLAEKDVKVDEEIMPHVPRNRLPIMTIHQAKGLEFPLVVVDVASDYTANRREQRFRRFPEAPTATQLLEDDMAPYCSIGSLRTARGPLARTFDDLVRLYYVAYSRPQSLLMLVGVDRCLRHTTTIKHVATGWRSNGTWAWQAPVSGRAPAVVSSCPLELI